MSHPKNTAFIDELNEKMPKEKDQESEKSFQSNEFVQLLNESLAKTSKKLSVGDRIKGQILVVGQEDVFVSTGTQHDGLISKLELLDDHGNCPFKAGDTLEVFVTQIRGSDIRLSKNPTDRNLAEDLEDAFDMMLPVQGKILEVCKGGVRVQIKGKVAFCPISQIDTQHVENAEDYVGKSFDFMITQFSEGGRNIVVSRKRLLTEERALSVGSFLEEHQDGEIVTGKVVRLEKFGAFVELAPGVDGLVHISEIAWSRIQDPADLLQVGQDVTVKILRRELKGDRTKLSLSIKQASSKDHLTEHSVSSQVDPWSKFQVKQILEGKVIRKEVYGFFIQLEPGIVGLLHKSKTQEHPEFHAEKLKVGDSVTVQIAEIRFDERRISLDVPRDPGEDDWREHKSINLSFGTLGDQLSAALAKKKKP